MPLQEICIKWEVFNFKAYCVIGPARCLPAYIKKRHRRVWRKKLPADQAGLYFKSLPKLGGILWLPEAPKTPKQIGHLTHEIGHAVLDMMIERGMEPKGWDDETFCYALAHGVEIVLEDSK